MAFAEHRFYFYNKLITYRLAIFSFFFKYSHKLYLLLTYSEPSGVSVSANLNQSNIYLNLSITPL